METVEVGYRIADGDPRHPGTKAARAVARAAKADVRMRADERDLPEDLPDPRRTCLVFRIKPTLDPRYGLAVVQVDQIGDRW